VLRWNCLVIFFTVCGCGLSSILYSCIKLVYPIRSLDTTTCPCRDSLYLNCSATIWNFLHIYIFFYYHSLHFFNIEEMKNIFKKIKIMHISIKWVKTTGCYSFFAGINNFHVNCIFINHKMSI
jgi:hypothetical protein